MRTRTLLVTLAITAQPTQSCNRAAKPPHHGRRLCLLSGCAMLLPAPLRHAAVPLRPAAAAASSLQQPAATRVAEWPGLEYLEPIYELKLSLDALVAYAGDQARWPAIRSRLERFSSGGLLSERFYYAGLCEQYTRKIVYADLPDFVKADKFERQAAIVDVLEQMEQLRMVLRDASPEAAKVQGLAEAAQRAMGRWLSFVPEAQVTRVGALFAAVSRADADKNGVISDAEAAALGAEDLALWKKRVELVGP